MQASQFICRSLRPPSAPPRHGDHSELLRHLLDPGAWQLPRESTTMPVLLEDELLRVLPEIREVPTHEVRTSRSVLGLQCTPPRQWCTARCLW